MTRRRDAEYAIELNRAPITWDIERGKLTFFGLPATMLWLNPSLLRLFQPVVNELSVPLFRLLIAQEASEAAEAHFETVIATLGETFEEGLLSWSRAMASAGWGKIEVLLYDEVDQRAVIVIKNPWELQMQGGLPKRWGCPFFKGMITGIFSRAFGVNCWAEEIETRAEEGSSSVEFHVYASDKTIAGELENVRMSQREQAQRRFERRTRELRASEEQHRAIMASLDDVVFTLDAEGRFTHYHVPSDQTAFHAAAEDIIGMHMSDALPPEVAEQFAAGLAQVMSGGASLTVNYARDTGGVTRFMSTRMTPLRPSSGEPMGVTAVERDVTEQRNFERAHDGARPVASGPRAVPPAIVEVWGGVLLLPLAGELDVSRGALVIERLREAGAEKKARHVVVELGGVELLDAEGAAALHSILREVERLEASPVLAGAKAAVLESLAPLGATSERTKSYPTVQAALEAIIEKR